MTATPLHTTWQPQPRAETLVQSWVQRILDHLPAARQLTERIHAETGTRLADWLDTVAIAAQDLDTEVRLIEAGFFEDDVDPAPFWRAWRHPGGRFPRIVQIGDTGAPEQLWLACDSVADFCARHADSAGITVEGAPFTPLRKARFAAGARAELWVVERSGGAGFTPLPEEPRHSLEAAEILERFRRRRRALGSDEAGFAYARTLIDDAVMHVGMDRACALFFRAERETWQARNHAARVQSLRQDRLGLGWANCDHHTYRSSRASFPHLIAALEKLGFQLRERFYAGREAGWGAQVLEQPRAGVVVFADVDLSPDEVLTDFAHEPLPERGALGTVGLWCALHGDSFLEAGLHHIACLADFAALRTQLESEGIATMPPFTDLSHLQQAFTEGERWPVAPERVEALVGAGHLTEQQAKTFRIEGAIGSHLENIQRGAGFQGFNQGGISEIITATDPRAQR